MALSTGHGLLTRARQFTGEHSQLLLFSNRISQRFYCSGKTLGGSSSINGGHWTRGLDAQYDAFSALLEPEDANVGWNWEGLFSYMKKVIITARIP